mgnify:FL=1|jgi:hypothetical protein|tara:strand:- start:52 stop:234 length:183 start_codon:yes stop_codon:yes gene_type:complete
MTQTIKFLRAVANYDKQFEFEVVTTEYMHGTKDELQFYRVMHVDQSEKTFYETKHDYECT